MSGKHAFPSVSEGVVQAISGGASIADAAVQAGVSERTVKNWLTKGRREPGTEYAAFAERVDALRAERELPDTSRMDEDELFEVVSGACRKGSVAAMKLLWEMLRADQNFDEDDEADRDPLKDFDELAVKRQARTG